MTHGVLIKSHEIEMSNSLCTVIFHSFFECSGAYYFANVLVDKGVPVIEDFASVKAWQC